MADEQIGRANVVLARGEGEEATAVLTHVTAKAVGHSEELDVSGAVEFAEPVLDHLQTIVLPVVRGVLTHLEIPLTGYQLSVSNVGAAAAHDIGLVVRGFSADLPIFLALLSSSLYLPIPTDVVCTGHIASLDGSVRLVRNLAAKLVAVCASSRVQRFVYPADDGSLALWSPAELERTNAALRAARGHVVTVPVADLAEVLSAVVSERSFVLASIESDYFRREPAEVCDGIARAAAVLKGGNVDRFWRVLEEDLFEENIANARRLLTAKLDWHVKHSDYPDGMGNRLEGLVCSLPPTGTILDSDDTLVGMDLVRSVCAFSECSHDAAQLTAAAKGPLPRRLDGPVADDILAKRLDQTLHRISQDAIAQDVSLAYDSARASYRLTRVTVKTHEELHDLLAAFYLHLQRKVGIIQGHVAREVVGPDALALLESAYSRNGGYRAALSEAQIGTNGGLRFILDAMTEEAKRKARQHHISWILKEALNALEHEHKVRFIGLFIERVGDHLPEGTGPPERYVEHYEELIAAYVQSMDEVKTLLKRW